MRTLQNFSRFFETVRHLRFGQFFFFLVKPLRKKIALYHFSKKNVSIPKRTSLGLKPFLSSENSLNENTFTFLNQARTFEAGNVDWSFLGHGLLWNYHLNYFDFLLQENLSAQQGLKLIHQFIDNANPRSDSYDPYPVSLRGINWIKFLIKNNIDDLKINESLFRQYIKLSHETERHLGANHLLENGFSLLHAAFYFRDKKFLKRAENILLRELEEQVLNDGAHYELSPMYHRIILHRILDCINLVQNNKVENTKLEKLLSEKAAIMLSWMNKMTFRNGELLNCNDSTKSGEVAPVLLNTYAKQLGVEASNAPLSDSGYRKFSFPKYELILDAGNIMPSYNPGHTHADMLSFCLNINDKPVVVDCGISTYENNSIRHYERSTAAHNTVSVDGANQSDIWASFRVGRRAQIIDQLSKENFFSATVKGFTSNRIKHNRQWEFSENRISITDIVRGHHQCKAFLHFHPETDISQKGNTISGNNFSITLSNHKELSVEDYDFAEGFNKTIKAKVAVILFSERLQTEINL